MTWKTNSFIDSLLWTLLLSALLSLKSRKERVQLDIYSVRILIGLLVEQKVVEAKHVPRIGSRIMPCAFNLKHYRSL